MEQHNPDEYSSAGSGLANQGAQGGVTLELDPGGEFCSAARRLDWRAKNQTDL
jgi:hypothetical protein